MPQQQDLKRIFPQTMDSLRTQKLEGVISEFNRFCSNDLTHSSDVTGWFPAFLKAHGISPEVTEICHYEWLKFSVVTHDWGERVLDRGQLGLALGVQIINLDKAAQTLAHNPGPVVIYNSKGKAQARSLTASEALCLDVLSEDRKFTVEQLIEFLKMEAQGVSSVENADWKSTIDRLIEEALLILKL